MSVARSETDRIRCDVSHCKATIWAGSRWHAETTEKARAFAAANGWDVTGRDLCPKHAHLATEEPV